MTAKICLRCDWQGETSEPACPNCGIRPLFLTAAPRPAPGTMPTTRAREGDGEVATPRVPISDAGSPTPTPSPSPRDAQQPDRRSSRARAAFVAAPLLLFVVVGVWLNAREGISTSAAAGATPRATPSDDRTAASPALTSPSISHLGSPTYAVGRQSLDVEGVPLSFSLPSEGWWRFGDLSVSKSTVGPQGAEAIVFWTSIADGTYADACGQWWGSPLGSVADWAQDASTVRGTDLVTGPQVVSIGGYAAQHVVFTVRKDVACNPGFFHRWKVVAEGPYWAGTQIGDTIRIWLVQVGETVLYIEGDTHSNAGAHLKQEVEKIVGSISFD
jgi:hypothetical protein